MVHGLLSKRNAKRYRRIPARPRPCRLREPGYLRNEDFAIEEATTARCSDDREGDEREQPNAIDPQCNHSLNHLLSLEPEVLERLCGAPVELRGRLVLTAPRCEVALGDPDRRAVADGGKLVKFLFGNVECARRFV
jgi:hypothetical protein